MKYQGILVLAEHDNKILKDATVKTLGAAKQLPGDITVLVAGFQCESVVEKVAKFEGVSRVWVLDALCFEHGLAENVAAAMAEIGKTFAYILAPATTYGKNILPRVAALLDVAQISDVTQVVSEDTFMRPIYAGNAVMTVKSLDPQKIMTIRLTAFEPVSMHAQNADFSNDSVSNPSASIEQLDCIRDLNLSQFVQRNENVMIRPELTSARVVIAGGRGLQSAENFKLLEDIADKLTAAIGASRAAVDAGYVPNDYQVGQTGKVVAPELYIAVGISGAIQHLSGMKDSKVIVAINKDASAPIFQVSDYGMVGDLFQILPELSEELSKRL